MAKFVRDRASERYVVVVMVGWIQRWSGTVGIMRCGPVRLVEDHEQASGVGAMGMATPGRDDETRVGGRLAEIVMVRRLPGIHFHILDVVAVGIVVTGRGEVEGFAARADERSPGRWRGLEFRVPHSHRLRGCIGIVVRTDLDRVSDDDISGNIADEVNRGVGCDVCIGFGDMHGRHDEQPGEDGERRDQAGNRCAWEPALVHGQFHSRSAPMAAFTQMHAAFPPAVCVLRRRFWRRYRGQRGSAPQCHTHSSGRDRRSCRTSRRSPLAR